MKSNKKIVIHTDVNRAQTPITPLLQPAIAEDVLMIYTDNLNI